MIEEEDQAGDEDMAEVEVEEVDPTLDDGGPTGLEDIEPIIPERTTFLEYDQTTQLNSKMIWTDRP